ncbi:MAG TPA: energy transducer TonB [Flavobacterium sp.]|nr:energy transducer TonB [Flavobacterium sp.]
MKSFFTLFISLMLGLSSFAQDVSQDSIYVVADVMPEYKDGGLDGFRKYVAQNYVVPDIVKTDLNGLVIVSLVVEPDGQLSTIQVLRDLGFGTGEEAVRVINTSEQWTPGFIKDKPVRVKLTLPIPIKVVAQTPLENSTASQDTIYTKTETMPQYEDGGIDGFRKFVAMNYNVPNNIPRAIRGSIIVHFVVERDGTLSSIKVLRDLGYGTGEEAARVIAKSKKWRPGFLNNKAVRVSYTFPIILNLTSPTMDTSNQSSNNIQNNSNDFNRSNLRAPKEFGPK